MLVLLILVVLLLVVSCEVDKSDVDVEIEPMQKRSDSPLPKIEDNIQNNILLTNIITLQLPPQSKVNYTPAVYFNYSNYSKEKSRTIDGCL